MGSTDLCVGVYLLKRLKDAGVDHIFGVPGDFVLGFFNQILQSDIKFVGTCNELNAAYAADGYARVKGIGCLSTTYCVGELSAINGVAGAWAEDLPIVKITGAPATHHYSRKTMLHHTLGDYHIPQRMFEKITVAHTVLMNEETAAAEIDRVLSACLTRKKPVYIALPADVIKKPIKQTYIPYTIPPLQKSDPTAVQEAVVESLTILQRSKKPILLPGIEICRYGLRDKFRTLLEKSGFPYSTMMLAKTVLDEDHPQFIGLYQGAKSRPYVKDRVEKSDCIIVFGEKMTDFNTGGFTASLNEFVTINASVNEVQISHHVYPDVYLWDYMDALTMHLVTRDAKDLDIHPASLGCTHTRATKFEPKPDKEIRMGRFFDRMSSFLPEGTIVIAETGASLFSAAETLMPKGGRFVGQTFYGSIGYTVGATLGLALAAPDKTVVLFIGDGSFQVTVQDVSTMLRYGCKNVIIFLVNNDGYTIERVIVDHAYNDIQPWKYYKLCEVFGGGFAADCWTEGQLEDALAKTKTANDLCFIEVHMPRWDCSDSLRAAGEAMAKNNSLLEPGGVGPLKPPEGAEL
ncbi:unnamed protein product [Vitrella brassicaformis CCMP3155]|uniref:Pyruvate decarboxylase n=1 Tax=Vitrella brassicaformis (strain CCMP3155) TaxID=1169540 RepID=A0A0G4EFN9_VITBC|nr:unnamed protein product [Vitrella brassicaformis CCMP3155]|mmetsp:Transcript_50092/g.125612  ORF Transcript_50092/g.125612 Transcript_50092/m.125612 type:complete len:574 (-) Transcript_50092:832-2553(-)|eukprot:CEL94316.1 unnamed protein product [Vitrella brassicaformis CCMP3155]